MSSLRPPLFSILVPAYREVTLLARLLSSVLVQSICDFELIISDDSNSPKIRELISSLDDPRIVYIANVPAFGAVSNWNKLLGCGRGEYIILMHHDECFVNSDCLREILSMHRKNNSVVISRLVLERASGRIQKYDYLFMRWLLVNFWPPGLFVYNAIGPVSTISFERRLTQVRFESDLKWLVDVEYYTRLLTKAKIGLCKRSTMLSHELHRHKITPTLDLSTVEAEERMRLLSRYSTSQRWMLNVGWATMDFLKTAVRKIRTLRHANGQV